MLHIAKRLAITLEDHHWIDPDGRIITVYRGFPTDGASLPWLAKWRWDPWQPDVLAAALPHDLGYSLHGTEFDVGTKRQVDRRFLQGMETMGFRADRLFWRAVQMGGHLSWRTPNNRHMEGYLWSLRNNKLDAWIESFRSVKVSRA